LLSNQTSPLATSPRNWALQQAEKSESALRKWVNQARIDEKGIPQGALTTSERQELVQLRRDNRRLQMERDFLKKAAAFFRKSVGGVPPLKGTAVAKDSSIPMS
jgi:transposase-like protein